MKYQTRNPSLKARPIGNGVIVVKQIPYGFFENGLRQYFSQFGTIIRLMLARSNKTGRSKGYAYIEYEEPEVAKIVAETMNNYLMYDKLLKCKVVDNPHPRMFKSSVNFYRRRRYIARCLFNKKKTDKRLAELKRKRMKKLNDIHEKLKCLGIEFDLNSIINKNDDENIEDISEQDEIIATQKSKFLIKTNPSKNLNNIKQPEATLPKKYYRKFDENLKTEKDETKSRNDIKDNNRYYRKVGSIPFCADLDNSSIKICNTQKKRSKKIRLGPKIPRNKVFQYVLRHLQKKRKNSEKSVFNASVNEDQNDFKNN